MDVGRIGDVLVFFFGIYEMMLGYIQAWIYQRTF